MKSGELMNLDPEWIPSSATALEAARIMRDRSRSYLLVFDLTPERRLRGIVTDRDLAIRVCAENKLAETTPVVDVATSEVVSCEQDDDLRVAEQKMRDAEMSRLVVLDKAGEVVGVLCLVDILRHSGRGRAVKTAEAVLAKDARGSQTPPERIKLTPSTLADEEAVAHQPSVMKGATRTDSMKVFPT
jgi:signal-transduction protein with cAMP-binding, CBS, and nucleotidyltransferase domain